MGSKVVTPTIMDGSSWEKIRTLKKFKEKAILNEDFALKPMVHTVMNLSTYNNSLRSSKDLPLKQFGEIFRFEANQALNGLMSQKFT